MGLLLCLGVLKDGYTQQYTAYQEPQEEGIYARPAQPWSFSFGLGGQSVNSDFEFIVAADIRYAWFSWLQSLLGLEAHLGSRNFVGLSFQKRAYLPYGATRPFAIIGYRSLDLANLKKTSAIELGAGLQMRMGPRFYYEFYFSYLVRKPFDSTAKNFANFGAGGGMNF